MPRFLFYKRLATYPDRSISIIKCASSFYWTGGTPYHMQAAPLEVTTGANISGIDLVLPMLEHES